MNASYTFGNPPKFAKVQRALRCTQSVILPGNEEAHPLVWEQVDVHAGCEPVGVFGSNCTTQTQ